MGGTTNEGIANGTKPPHYPQMHLILFNISKKNNVKSLLKAAVAHGCGFVFMVGQRKFDLESGDVPPPIHEALRNETLRIERFSKLEECIHFLRNDFASSTERSVRIVGVEIVEGATNLETTPFHEGHTVLMMGNEGSGMNKKQLDACDGFVTISQYGGGTASLNVSVAANIVMHRFFVWSRSPQYSIKSLETC